MWRFVVFLLVLLSVNCSLYGRTWSDVSGKYRIEAEFVTYGEGKVTLRKKDGSTIKVPLKILSEQDVLFLRNNTTANIVVKPQTPLSNTALVNWSDGQDKAKTILQMYQDFLENSDVPEEEKAKARRKLPYWERYGQTDCRRLGTRWFEPEKIVEILQLEEKLLLQAKDILLEARNVNVAEDLLEKASKTNPAGIRPDFVIGLCYSLVGRNAAQSEKHFEECCKRRRALGQMSSPQRANMIALLNNTAITKVRLGKHSSAFKLWQEASELGPMPTEVIHNLGRYLYLSQVGRLVGNANHPGTKGIANLHSDLLIESQGKSLYDKNTGWLFIPLVKENTVLDTKNEPATEDPPAVVQRPPTVTRPIPNGQSPSGSSIPDNFTGGTSPGATTSSTGAGSSSIGGVKYTLIAGGSGFVIHPGYILASRHVVDSADRVMIEDPTTGKQVAGRVHAMSEGADLAILHAPGISAPCTLLAASLPNQEQDIALMGFTRVGFFADKLKAVKGKVTAMPTPETSNMFLVSAVASRGNAGGPVFGQSGAVIGVITKQKTTGIPGTGHFERFTMCTPALDALKLAMKEVPGYAEASSSGRKTPGPWEDLIKDFSKSTVKVFAQQRTIETGIAKSESTVHSVQKKEAKTAWKPFEDKWCMNCDGHKFVECPVSSCSRGTVPYKKQIVIGINPVTRQKIYGTTTVKVSCGRGQGNGKISCPLCTNGIEPGL